MNIVCDSTSRANPAPSRFEAWPAWTDADRWELGPDPDTEDTTDHSAILEPTPAEQAERLAWVVASDRLVILSADERDADEELMIGLLESQIADREAEMVTCANRWDHISCNEIIEARGHRSSVYEE